MGTPICSGLSLDSLCHGRAEVEVELELHDVEGERDHLITPSCRYVYTLKIGILTQHLPRTLDSS